ncbi:MAG TPA: hypothetical protein VMS11_08000 [Solirubrobacterales bacterium]|nr:hypothetical protein [Solirubrobacterales bacterium]
MLATVAALVAIAAAAALALAPDPEDPNERLALRLSDLPPGYFPLDIGPEGTGIEFACEGIRPSDPNRWLDRYVKRFDPVGCLGIYLRAYRVPGPARPASVVGTGAMRSNSIAGAVAGFVAAGELLGKLVGKRQDLEEWAAEETVGEATRLFHWGHVPRAFLRNDRRGSFVVWRSGRVVSATFAAAPSFPDSDRIALELAQRQQAHVEHPTVYSEEERDDSEVALDDPSLTLPVHWLGHDFAPGHGLPSTKLQQSFAIGPASDRQLVLEYTKGIELQTWASTDWKKFVATPAGRRIRYGRCAKATEVPLVEGHAFVVAYRRDSKSCAGRSPDRFKAFAYFGSTVVAVLPSCGSCRAGANYDTPQGMKAIVRGLELRPKPVF